MIIEVSKAAAVLTTSFVLRLLKSKVYFYFLTAMWSVFKHLAAFL